VAKKERQFQKKRGNMGGGGEGFVKERQTTFHWRCRTGIRKGERGREKDKVKTTWKEHYAREGKPLEGRYLHACWEYAWTEQRGGGKGWKA